MEINFEHLVAALSISPSSIDILRQITCILKQQTDESLLSFVSHSFQSILVLQRWTWQLLSRESRQWINQPCYLEMLYSLASLNKQIIFHCDNIEDEIKGSLFIPETIDQVNRIFEQIESSNYDNDSFITIASLWFDNLSFLLQEYSQLGHLPIITHINQYFGRNFIINKQFKFYLIQLQQSQLLPSIFTAKQLFYIKTCSFSLNAYFYTKPPDFPFTANQIFQQIGNDYLQMIQTHSYRIDSWSNELFTCITHLIGFICACSWWGRKDKELMKILFPTEPILCEYIKALIRIIDYEPFHKQMKTKRSNNETILVDVILFALHNIVQARHINWFFRSMTQLPDILLKVAESSTYYRICLCIYSIFGDILTDEKLRRLKFTDTMSSLFFHMLQDAYHHPLKKYKQIPITHLLKGFLSLSKNDSIQQKTADLNETQFFVRICDQYPIVYDILWALSFNTDVQKQLHSNASFMSKLYHLTKVCDNEQMRKITHGLLWNLKSHHNDRSISEINDEKKFDIMISYSYKDKILCQQLYEELTKASYHVWIDFDQMHGNVMDAMAQAIEQSHTIIICMSEDYRKSNYCRAEAHYAFQCQRKIVPVLLQEHYKPDGWLLFLIGQLIYVDFTKYEFGRAIEMLTKELKTEDVYKTNVVSITRLISPPPTFPKNILEYTSTHVQDWLKKQNLVQMTRLLANCNGRSLMYLNDFITNGKTQQILLLLQEDSLRRSGENLSLIELSCFQSLMDEQKQLLESTIGTRIKTDSSEKKQ